MKKSVSLYRKPTAICESELPLKVTDMFYCCWFFCFIEIEYRCSSFPLITITCKLTVLSPKILLLSIPLSAYNPKKIDLSRMHGCVKEFNTLHRVKILAFSLLTLTPDYSNPSSVDTGCKNSHLCSVKPHLRSVAIRT